MHVCTCDLVLTGCKDMKAIEQLEQIELHFSNNSYSHGIIIVNDSILETILRDMCFTCKQTVH